MQVDTTKQGLEVIFKPYQVVIVKKLVADKENVRDPIPMSSRDMWDYCNEQLPGSISRASVINFLNDMVDKGVFGYNETTGKGGYRRKYWSNYYGISLEEWIKLLVSKALDDAFRGSWWQ